jgi:cell filamentation protein
LTDPYVYPGTHVLANHFGLQDEEKLGRIERMISVEAILELRRSGASSAPFDLDRLRQVHRTIFEDVYPFAGDLRTIEMSKAEPSLSGRSIRYGHPEEIDDLAGDAVERLANVDFSELEGPGGWRPFCDALAELWRAHPFREGNTRTILVFADLLLRDMGVPVDFTVISDSPATTRDEFVRATEGYGRGLEDIFRKARASHVRRDHPDFGHLTREAADKIEAAARHGDVATRRSFPGEVLRGAVLCTSGRSAILQTSRGLVAVPLASFPAPPADGDRASAIVAMSDFDNPFVSDGDYETARLFRNAMLAAPSLIELPEDSDDFITYAFEDPDLAALAEEYPEILSETAEKVLRATDVDAWSDWAERRYSAGPRF